MVEETFLSDLSFEYSCFWFQPILRDAFEKDPSMSLEEARQVITKCLQVLFYRDARSLNKVCITFLYNVESTRCHFSFVSKVKAVNNGCLFDYSMKLQSLQVMVLWLNQQPVRKPIGKLLQWSSEFQQFLIADTNFFIYNDWC